MKQIKQEKTISQLQRTRQVVSVMAKYGFEDVLAHPPLKQLIPRSEKWLPSRAGRSITDYSRYERIRLVCEELGTTFIKFAQIASNRPDILPDDLISELTKLQDAVPSVPRSEIHQILEEDFGADFDSLVEQFEYQPLASASIAQVHRATLTGGKKVVLKIQRPNIESLIKADIKILLALAEIIEQYFPKYAIFQPVELVKVFEGAILKELKFNLEATNLVRFQRLFRERKEVYVPSVYPELSNKRVLCMEFIEGTKISNLKKIEELGLDRKELARTGIDLYFDQIFHFGFFHADPHPGNIFVLENGKVCFLDFGMMGTVSREDKKLIADILLAVTSQNAKSLKNILVELSTIDQIEHFKNLENEITDILNEYAHLSIGEIRMEELSEMLNLIFFKYKMKIPANLLLLLKVLVIVEGVGLKLDPDFNVVKNLKPYITKLWKIEFSPDKIKNNSMQYFGELFRLATNFPEDAQEIISKLKKGKLHIEFEHKGLEQMYKKMEIVSNRISVALVLSALLLSSSLLVYANMPPYIFNIPILGFLGFSIAGIVTLRLVWSIWQHENF